MICLPASHDARHPTLTNLTVAKTHDRQKVATKIRE